MAEFCFGIVLKFCSQYDDAFEPCSEHQKDPEHPLTYAEMPSEQKNGFSHRRRALDGLRNWVEAHLDLFA